MEKALDVSKFLLVTDPCRTAATLCADPDHALFFDDVHLSEFAQSDLAVAVEALLISWDDRSSIPEIDRWRLVITRSRCRSRKQRTL